MKKGDKSIFACSECGYQTVRWLGKCPECGGWNTFMEEFAGKSGRISSGLSSPEKIHDIEIEKVSRAATGIGEFDRVSGGGVVNGSLVLMSGEPGIGKSTLLLTISGRLSGLGKRVLYISAEESKTQVKLRAERLEISSENLYLLCTTELVSIKEALKKVKPDFVIVDSIQTIFDSDIPSTPGSVTQVRENANFFLNYSKNSGSSVFLIGHITKEGVIAGPKLLEHVVDIVLSFEGEPRSNLRILRASKNRFGSTAEIGVFSMEENGLQEIPEASSLFLPSMGENLPGSVIFPNQEGSRTLLLEIQSLVAPSYYGVPKRSVIGIDYNRVSMILAVLEKKAGFNFNSYDVYCNTGGGLKISETSSDLAVAISCVSALKDIPVLGNSVFMGEVALTGEIRHVAHLNRRIGEAERLGFKKAVIPHSNLADVKGKTILEVIPVKWLKEAIALSMNCL
ncbi:MAG TPA: DNA repair protein RadA [bacterium]|nr:DNA repair protein RadA [bacterium]